MVSTVSIYGNEFETNLYCNPTGCQELFEFKLAHQIYEKKLMFIVQGYVLKDCALNQKH